MQTDLPEQSTVTSQPRTKNYLGLIFSFIAIGVGVIALGFSLYVYNQIRDTNDNFQSHIASLGQSIAQQAAQFYSLQQKLEGVSKKLEAVTAQPTLSPENQKTWVDIENLIQHIQQMTFAPDMQNFTQSTPAIINPEWPWYKRFYQRLKHDVKSLFIIRRFNDAEAPFMSPQQQMMVKQNCVMQLSFAEFALLHQDVNLYQTAIKNVISWISQYWTNSDDKTNLLNQLADLQARTISQTSPQPPAVTQPPQPTSATTDTTTAAPATTTSMEL